MYTSHVYSRTVSPILAENATRVFRIETRPPFVRCSLDSNPGVAEILKNYSVSPNGLGIFQDKLLEVLYRVNIILSYICAERRKKVVLFTILIIVVYNYNYSRFRLQLYFTVVLVPSELKLT